MPDEESVESYELGGGETIVAGQKGPTDSPSKPGARGTYSVSRGNLSELESRRLIANIPDRETAQRLTTNVGRATEFHRERSARARTVDEQRRATVTTNFEQWASDPRRWDFPGVDDPRTTGPEATGAERFQHKVETGKMYVDTPGPDMFDYRDLEDSSPPPASAASGPREMTPGVGSIERDDEAAWENGSPGVGTIEADDEATWLDPNDKDQYGRASWGLPPLEDMVGQKETEELMALREHKFEAHSKARKHQKAKGRTAGRETIEDDAMRGYLSDIRTIEDELYERGALD